MVHGSQNRGSWASWGPTIIFSEKKSPYLNNLSLDPIVSDAVWGCLGVSEGESWCIWVVFWDVKAALEVFGGYLRVESIQN